MTDYYIDFVNGDDANGGTSPTDAWKTITQFLANCVAGDTCILRGNQTHTYSADLDTSVAGTDSAWITIRDYDSSTDIADANWEADEGTLPIIDFGDAAYQFIVDLDYYYLKDFKIKDSTDTTGSLYLVATAKVENLTIYKSTSGNYYGMYVYSSADYMEIKNCEIYNFTGAGIFIVSANKISIAGSDIHDNEDGIKAYYNYRALIDVSNTSFSNNTDAIEIADANPSIKIKNCTFTSNTNDFNVADSNVDHPTIQVWSRDGSEVHMFYINRLKVERDTTVYTGNADSSLKCTPESASIEKSFLKMQVFEWKITDVTAASHTVTVQVRGSGWTSFPNSDELYIEVEYYDEATGTHTATAKSTDTLSANDTWTSFSVSFTPVQVGDIYVRGYLKKYESGAVIYFNGEVEIT